MNYTNPKVKEAEAKFFATMDEAYNEQVKRALVLWILSPWILTFTLLALMAGIAYVG